jgi:predicted Zn-dependent protease
MTKETTAVFYDGISSVAQEIILIFDVKKEAFYFKSSENNYSWDITNVDFITKRNWIELQYGDDPLMIIKIEDKIFIDTIISFRVSNNHINWYQKLLDLDFKIHFGIAISILGLIALCYLYIIPWAGEKSTILIPERYDTKLGSVFFQNNTLLSTVDSLKTNHLNEFAKELKLKNRKALHFIVIDSNIENAFALPDGTIVVYTGIIDLMDNYEELVGLIGHEVAHVNHRHSMKMLCRNLSGYLFISTVLGDANGVMAVLGENVNTLQSLSFSREFEHEADTEGLKIVIENKVNPYGMQRLFKKLQTESKIEIPEFLSSHPVTKDRILNINKMIKTNSFRSVKNSELTYLFNKIKDKE